MSEDNDEQDARNSGAGNQTMQIDALVDELRSDDAMPADAVLAQILTDSGDRPEPAFSAPPPLPPKKVSPGTIVIGVLVVGLATAGGIFLGMSFLEEPATPAPDVVAGDGAEPVEAVDPNTAGEGAYVPIQLGEVVVPHPDDEILEGGEGHVEGDEEE